MNFLKKKQGILIIIDDINGLSEHREFADWYKKLADTLAVSNHYELPAYFLLAGYPEKFEALVVHEESFGSIFHFDSIDCLSDDEVIEFFKDTFKQVGIEISDNTLSLMVTFSSGLPLMMQQIGDSIFWICENNYINEDDALTGIIDAANVTKLIVSNIFSIPSLFSAEIYNICLSPDNFLTSSSLISSWK